MDGPDIEKIISDAEFDGTVNQYEEVSALFRSYFQAFRLEEFNSQRYCEKFEVAAAVQV